MIDADRTFRWERLSLRDAMTVPVTEAGAMRPAAKDQVHLAKAADKPARLERPPDSRREMPRRVDCPR